MKNFLPLTVLCLSLGLAAPLAAQTPTPPKTEKEKLGYALGMDVGSALKKQPFEFDKQFFISALRDSLGGGAMAMSDEQVKDVIADLNTKMRAKQLADMTPEQRAEIAKRQAAMEQAQAGDAAGADKNKAAGAKYLAANKGKPGIQTLPDGMQYKVVSEGSGPSPKATDTVTVKYRGTLIDGTEFDASEKHGGTATFPVDGVIKGWTEALLKMKAGAKWQLFIPSELAYGDRSPSPDIQPGSTLLFDVELVSIGK